MVKFVESCNSKIVSTFLNRIITVLKNFKEQNLHTNIKSAKVSLQNLHFPNKIAHPFTYGTCVSVSRVIYIHEISRVQLTCVLCWFWLMKLLLILGRVSARYVSDIRPFFDILYPAGYGICFAGYPVSDRYLTGRISCQIYHR